MKPIFIISQHRTGSTLLKNILNAHTSVVMAFDEMNIYEPYRKNTLDKLIPKYLKSPNDLMTAIDEKQIYGTFWKEFNKSKIDKLKFVKSLNESELFDEMEILRQVLINLRGSNINIIPGVKYPVHFSKINKLKAAFNDCRIIFLTRNPKAIIASKLNDPATLKRKNKSFIHSLFIHYFTILYFCLEYNQTIKLYLKYSVHSFQISYEELIKSENSVERICEYLDIDFEKEMLNINGKKSSYERGEIAKPKFFLSSIDKYKEILSPFDSWLISILTKK